MNEDELVQTSHENAAAETNFENSTIQGVLESDDKILKSFAKVYQSRNWIGRIAFLPAVCVAVLGTQSAVGVRFRGKHV
jgi:hypothetical protein